MPQPGIQEYDADGRLICLECGRPFSLLAPHLAQTHGMTTAQYRETHQLPRRLSLRSAALSARARQQGTDRYAQRPDIREAMQRGRTQPTETNATASSQETATRPMVRQARQRGGQGRADAARRLMDSRAQAVGFVNLAAYFEGRSTESVAAMARELGASRGAVAAWRQRLATGSGDADK